MTEPRMVRFISERVTVTLAREPDLAKKPECPTEFVWRGERFAIAELLSEWHEYERHGRMAENMRPAHLATAALRGSWGVGRHVFRVRTEGGRIFDLYYDRAPRGAMDRAGSWWLRGELATPAPTRARDSSRARSPRSRSRGASGTPD